MMQIQNLKFKVQNCNLKFKILIFILLLALNSTVLTSAVKATDASPSADIKSKLEELKKEIASKAAKLKQEVDRKLKNKAYVGKVKANSETSLTLATESGPKMVSINQDTVFESRIKGRKNFSQKVVAEEDYIATLGDADETGVLIAKKIILLPTPNLETKSKSNLWGQIISISDKLTTLKNKDLKNVAVSLLSPSEVKLNDFVILTGSKDKNDIFDARFVYIIPQGATLKPKKIASPSAQAKSDLAQVATKSATPKPTSR